MSRDRSSKGRFGPSRLEIADRYVVPARRRWMTVVGLALAVAVGALVAWDVTRGGGRLVSAGPLSSAHAVQQSDCFSCHRRFEAPVSEKCVGCHEAMPRSVGAYGWDAHYLYGTDDFRRVVRSGDEVACASCHREHRGRDASLVRVADPACTVCHEAHDFGTEHPEFFFARDGAPRERPGIAFDHAPHLREIMTRDGLEDPQGTCWACHEPDPDGRGFTPLDFDRACDRCHLTVGVATPRLPVVTADRPGVETIETIRAHGGPGTDWVLFANPTEYREAGPTVMKTPLHHEDPWILYNLRRLRRELYADTGLADLLVASPDVEPDRVRDLYREALDRLQADAVALRSRPEPAIQSELESIEATIAGLRREIADPYAPIDPHRFLLALDTPREDVSPERREEVETLIADLTLACRQCHSVERATFVRVQKDQGQLHRARFDHGAHVVQLRCAECHPRSTEPTAVGQGPATSNREASVVQDLPTITTCRRCHGGGLAASSCVTCHRFHPGGTPVPEPVAVGVRSATGEAP